MIWPNSNIDWSDKLGDEKSSDVAFVEIELAILVLLQHIDVFFDLLPVHQIVLGSGLCKADRVLEPLGPLLEVLKAGLHLRNSLLTIRKV